MSAAEDLLAYQLKAVGIPFEREVVFAAPRKWRADFVVHTASVRNLGDWAPLLIEIDGATWTGGRHVTGAGVERDCEKANAATLLGYRLLRFVPHQVESGVALHTIEKALGHGTDQEERL